MTQHKWHKEIQAWSEGAEIEFRYEDLYKKEWSEWELCKEPIFFLINFEFRIKPLDSDGKEVVAKLQSPLYTHPKEWQSLSGEEFVAIAKSIWGDNLGMGDGYGYTVAWASSYATIEPSSKMLLLLQAIDKALKEKNDAN